MHSVARYISIIGLFLFCPVICLAEKDPITHEFQTMKSPSDIQYSDSYHKAKTDLLTYTCSSGAVFGLDLVNASGYKKTSINMASVGDYVTTTAVDSLTGIRCWFYPSGETRENIELRVSRDSIHWSEPIVVDNMYTSKGMINATFIPGRYYVRLTNTKKNKSVSIFKIQYSFGGCDCQLYIPEE